MIPGKNLKEKGNRAKKRANNDSVDKGKENGKMPVDREGKR